MGLSDSSRPSCSAATNEEQILRDNRIMRDLMNDMPGGFVQRVSPRRQDGADIHQRGVLPHERHEPPRVRRVLQHRRLHRVHPTTMR